MIDGFPATSLLKQLIPRKTRTCTCTGTVVMIEEYMRFGNFIRFVKKDPRYSGQDVDKLTHWQKYVYAYVQCPCFNLSVICKIFVSLL